MCQKDTDPTDTGCRFLPGHYPRKAWVSCSLSDPQAPPPLIEMTDSQSIIVEIKLEKNTALSPWCVDTGMHGSRRHYCEVLYRTLGKICQCHLQAVPVTRLSDNTFKILSFFGFCFFRNLSLSLGAWQSVRLSL